MSNVQVNMHDHVYTLTLNRADKKNALIPQMYNALANGIETAQNDRNCRVILINAEGHDFTAGNDLNEFANADEDSTKETVAFMHALLKCPLPVVVAVKGNAVGIGTTMLMHCDFVVSANNARFMMPFINLGLVPEYASSFLIPKTAGYLNAAKWLLLGEPFDATTALQSGIVSEVVAPELLQETSEAICKKLVNKPRNALLQTKALLKNDTSHILDVIDKELVIFAKALHSESAKEAFDAFLNKRPVNRERFIG